MASRTCWNCGRLTHMTMTDGGLAWMKREDHWGNHIAQQMMVCDNCGAASIVTGALNIDFSNPRQVFDTEDKDELPFGPGWLPQSAAGRDFPDVPDHIAAAADEAYRCQSITAHRAAGALARAVIEATCKDKKITKGDLATKIDKLASDGHIRDSIQAAAHEVRHFGNDMAHGDFVDPVTAEEAGEALELMSMVLREVYQEPAMLAKIQTARVKKASAAPADRQ